MIDGFNSARTPLLGVELLSVDPARIWGLA